MDTQDSVLMAVTLMCLGPWGGGKPCQETYLCIDNQTEKQNVQMSSWAMFHVKAGFLVTMRKSFPVSWIKHALSVLPYWPAKVTSHPLPLWFWVFQSLAYWCLMPNLFLYNYGCKSTSSTWSSQGLHCPSCPQRMWSSYHLTDGCQTHYCSQRHPLCFWPHQFFFYLCGALSCLHLFNTSAMSINLPISWVWKKYLRLHVVLWSPLLCTRQGLVLRCALWSLLLPLLGISRASGALL